MKIMILKYIGNSGVFVNDSIYVSINNYFESNELVVVIRCLRDQPTGKIKRLSYPSLDDFFSDWIVLDRGDL